jgi:hypothetical protein
MGELDIIIKEKNEKIEKLKGKLSRLNKELEDQKKEFSKKTNGMLTKKAVAKEIYERLKKMKILGMLCVIGCPTASIVANIHGIAGAVLGLTCAIAGTFIFKNDILEEMKRISSEYGL